MAHDQDDQKEHKKKSKSSKAKKIRQVKILSIAASPEWTEDILYEKEQETLLDAFNVFDGEALFLDMPDPVKSTLEEIKERLKTGRHDVLYITAHAYLDKKGRGVLAFEDEYGSLEEVSGKKLARAILPLSPSVVIFSCSHYGGTEYHLPEVAKSLHSGGVDRVIVMKKPLSPPAAMDFNRAFFSALLDKKNIKEAFDLGKQAIAAGEKDTPQLFLAHQPVSILDFSHNVIETFPPENHPFVASNYKYIGSGFIGRRDVLRKIYREIDDGEAPVVLKGRGGVGKSAVLTRVAAELKKKKFDILALRGVVSAEMVLKKIAQKAFEMGVKEAETIFESRVEYKEKLEKLLENFVYKKKLLLLFEDFDENQSAEGEFLNERLKELLFYLKDILKDKDSLMIFSTRYHIPKFTEDSKDKDKARDRTIEIEPFSWLEFRKLIFRTAVLKRLNEKSLKYLYFEMGGYPRAVELLDKIACREFGDEDFEWAQLRARVPDLTERILYKESETADFSYLLFEPLLGYLDENQRQILDTLSIYRGWVTKEALEGHHLQITPKDRKKLEELSLINYLKKKGDYNLYVHRLTAQVVQGRMEEAELKEAHLCAARYFEGLSPWAGKQEENRKFDENDLEARWHYIEAGHIDTAAVMTFGMDGYFCSVGYPQFAFDLVKDMEKHEAEMEEDKRLYLHNRLAVFYSLFGKLDEALKQNEITLEIVEARGDTRSVAVNLGQMGMIYEAKGEYDDALKNYGKSLEASGKVGDRAAVALRMDQMGSIYKRQGNYDDAREKYLGALEIDRENKDEKRISNDLEQLGRIHDEQGQFNEALNYYEQSLEIKEKLEDKPGIAALVHQMGNVKFFTGNVDESFGLYERSLKIKEETGDLKGAGYSLGQMGLIFQRKGKIDEALAHYEKSLENFEKSDEQKGIAASHHQIGRIHEARGDRDTALTHYEKALELREKHGDMLGAAITYGQLGMLYFAKEEYEPALRYSVQAFAIFSKYGSPNMELARRNMLRIREKMPIETFNDILKEFNINTGPSKEAEPGKEKKKE